MKNNTHCAGCRKSFESYGMTESEAVKIDGKVYCNSDCEMESGVKNAERQQYEALSAEL